jgi:hypothetical protein
MEDHAEVVTHDVASTMRSLHMSHRLLLQLTLEFGHIQTERGPAYTKSTLMRRS